MKVSISLIHQTNTKPHTQGYRCQNKMKANTDRNGNVIGNGKYHVDYSVFEIEGVRVNVVESNTTESVYVTYSINDKSITVRFSFHENNATKFGDQLNGNLCSINEVKFALGLISRKFIPETYLMISSRQVSKKDIAAGTFEESNLTIQEMYDLGEGASLAEHKGKLAKGSNYLILDDQVTRCFKTRRNFLGQEVYIGTYIYE